MVFGLRVAKVLQVDGGRMGRLSRDCRRRGDRFFVFACAFGRRFNLDWSGIGRKDVAARAGILHIFTLGQLVEMERGIDAVAGQSLGIGAGGFCGGCGGGPGG